jgi:hypothetical protein
MRFSRLNLLKSKINGLYMIGDYRLLNSKIIIDGIIFPELQETIEELNEVTI